MLFLRWTVGAGEVKEEDTSPSLCVTFKAKEV